MAITRAQQAKQMLQSGGEVLGPLGESDLTNQLSPGTIGKGLAFVLSGGLTGGATAMAKELAKQKIIDEAQKKVGDVIRPRLLTQVMQEDNRARGIGGYQSDFAQDSDFMGGKGTAAEMGSFADGGNVVGGEFDFESARQMYGLGKLVKKATRAVKKVAKSDLGKAAIAAAGIYYLGGGFGRTSGGFKFGNLPGSSFFGKGSLNPLKMMGTTLPGQATQFTSSPFANLIGGKVGAGILGTSALAGLMTPEEEEEESQAQLAKAYGEPLDFKALRPYGPLRFEGVAAANGGRIQYQEGSKEPVAKKTMPLLDMGGKEMDLREEGGFVPIGRMEKADDVPARLSKNEFVFTADAVRNAGDGNVDKGAEVMYNMMKNLEAGGDVSEESQGLEGARKMFQTSQRLEEVL